MTEPHRNALGQPSKPVPIEDVARSLGVESVQVVDPYCIAGSIGAIQAALASWPVSRKRIPARRQASMNATTSPPGRPKMYWTPRAANASAIASA